MVGTKYLEGLEKLKGDITSLSEVAVACLDAALQALEKRDLEGSEKVFHLEEQADELYTKIEERCIKMIALYQPVASDLRFLTSAMSVGSNLERSADRAVDIVKIVPYIADESQNIKRIFNMGKIAGEMTLLAAQAFVKKDEKKVMVVIRKEERVNEHYKGTFPELYNCVLPSLNQNKQEKCLNGCFILSLNLLIVSRCLERIGDHAVNVANKTLYTLKGKEEYL